VPPTRKEVDPKAAETGVSVVLRLKYKPVNVLPGSVVFVPEVLVSVIVRVLVALTNENSAEAAMGTLVADVPLPLTVKSKSARLCCPA
jgi:hypothetical protein